MSECPICLETAVLTRHHLVPKAAKGKNRGNILEICRECHLDVHDLHGQGDSYTGPSCPVLLVESLSGDNWDRWRAIRKTPGLSRQELVDLFIKESRRQPHKVRKALWLMELS